MIITPAFEAFDVEFLGIKTIYTRMLGHDTYSIVAGNAYADASIAQLQEYQDKGDTLILSSHYTPEDFKDVSTKIAYLKSLKDTATISRDAQDFNAAV